MKTEHLDKEIEFLEELDSKNELIPLEIEKLTEFKSIKEQLRLHGVSQHRELLIDCVKTCLKDKDSITVEQQVGNYLFLKGN